MSGEHDPMESIFVNGRHRRGQKSQNGLGTHRDFLLHETFVHTVRYRFLAARILRNSADVRVLQEHGR